MSRPKKDVTRDKALRIRLTQEEYEMIKYYAEKNNMSMSEAIRQSVLSTVLMCKIYYEYCGYPVVFTNEIKENMQWKK